MLRNNKDKYLELARMQSAGNVEGIDSIRRSLGIGDRLTAGNIAHDLKGASGNLGFTALYDAAKELNDLLRQPEFDEQRLQALIAELESAQLVLATALDG